MNILLTICARGGSKGVKNKNIKDLAGKPLIAYTIDLAKCWGKAKRIICSTDAVAIADLAKAYGIEVPFLRPPELATDTAGKLEVIRHALQECETKFSETYDLIVDLDVTSPIRSIKDLDCCLKQFKEKKPEVLFSVVEARRNPYFNMVEMGENNFAYLCKKSNQKYLRRQDAPKVYDMNASIYFYDRNFLLNKEFLSPLSSSRIVMYVMNELSGIDIDSELDFKYIEFLLQQKVISL